MVESSEEATAVYRLRRVGAPASLQNIGDVFRLEKDVTVIGRNVTNSDIFLDSVKNKALISRLHARIIAQKDANDKTVFKICDTSLNGTYVNDIKVADTVDLSSGDVVTFGHTRGAVLDAGTFAQQPRSEFRFKFEEVYMNDKSSELNATQKYKTRNKAPKKNSPKTPLASMAHFLPNLSSFLTPCTPSCSTRINKSDTTVHNNESSFISKERVSNTSVCSSDLDDDSDHGDYDLLELAIAAADAMSESDDEIFSLEAPCTLAVTDTNFLTSTGSHPMCQRNGYTNVKIQNGKVDVESNGMKVVPRKRRKTTAPQKYAKKHLNNSMKEDANWNTCASVDCTHPHDKKHLVTWVQCDDCDEWYHLKCTGLTLKSVKPKAAKFHCGCA